MNFFKKWSWTLAVLMLVVLPFPAAGQFIFDENPLLNKQTPNFTLELTTGETKSLNDYRGNAPALIFFWATWCPHCRDELKSLSRQSSALEKSGVKIILVNVEESPKLVKAFMNKLQLPFPVFLDERSAVSEQYSIIGLPTVFFVNKDGVVVGMEHGLPDNFTEYFKN